MSLEPKVPQQPSVSCNTGLFRREPAQACADQKRECTSRDQGRWFNELARVYSSRVADTAATEPPTSATAPDYSTAGIQQRVAEFDRRLAYLLANYRWANAVSHARLGFNASLVAGRRAGRPRAKRKPPRTRISPELELLISHRGRDLAIERGSNSGSPTPDDIAAASAEVLAKHRPRRGRPANPILIYHVHAFMVLYRWASGAELAAGDTRNGSYAPHIRSGLQDAITGAFRSVDPPVTVATLATIIASARRSGEVDGKRFGDLFPFYGGGVDAETGQPMPGPGFRLEQFEPIVPIYSS